MGLRVFLFVTSNTMTCSGGFSLWPKGSCVHKQRENCLLPALIPTKLLGLLKILPELVQFASRFRKL